MKPEQRMWHQLRSSIGPRWDAQRHEDKFHSGIPDVSFGVMACQGWIELKVIEGWPKLGSPVRVPHLTPQQKNWLWLRGLSGGRTWLLLKIQETSEWMLFDHLSQRDVGKVTQGFLRTKAQRVWKHVPPPFEFLAAVTGYPQAMFEPKTLDRP